MNNNSGFTLIELSIVLVIIGLIVGGVLVGQDLIRAAYIRAQISQIEGFNTAVNTFYGKYQALPGDMNPTVASANGFAARAGGTGLGNGDGLITGATDSTLGGQDGEATMFWVDLTYANGLNINLIPGSFSSAIETVSMNGGVNIQGTLLPTYLPAAKIGGGNYVYVWSTGGINYYGLSQVTSISSGWDILSYPAISVSMAYNIDRKVDDGLPQSGNITTQFISVPAIDPIEWAIGGFSPGGPGGPVPYAVAAASSKSCYDNGGNGGVSTYSMSTNNGAGLNCALSFKFQSGD